MPQPERDSEQIQKGTKRMSNDIKISKKTVIRKAAGAVAHKLRAGEEATVSGLGNLGVVKATQVAALARRYCLEDGGFEITIRPEFLSVEFEDGVKKGIRFNIAVM